VNILVVEFVLEVIINNGGGGGATIYPCIQKFKIANTTNTITIIIVKISIKVFLCKIPFLFKYRSFIVYHLFT
jgi:hypothetical protein